MLPLAPDPAPSHRGERELPAAGRTAAAAPTGIFALLFHLIGVVDFVMTLSQGADYQAGTAMTPEQVAHYQAKPAWMTVVWAVGVFTAFVASNLMLLRRKLALPVLAFSLAAFLGSVLYNDVLTDGGAVLGRSMAIASAGIAALLVVFIGYSQLMTVRGVLRRRARPQRGCAAFADRHSPYQRPQDGSSRQVKPTRS